MARCPGPASAALSRGSGEQVCGGDAKRFCADLAEQRSAERRVERHDFQERRRLLRETVRDSDAYESSGIEGAENFRRAGRNARRDAAEPFRPRPADATAMESARVCREAVGR